jgi:hypothetical protein
VRTAFMKKERKLEEMSKQKYEISFEVLPFNESTYSA